MPKDANDVPVTAPPQVGINFCFQGWVRGATVRVVTDSTGHLLDVAGMSSKKVAEKLNSGEWAISLGNYLYDNCKNEIEIFDFEVDL